MPPWEIFDYTFNKVNEIFNGKRREGHFNIF